MQTSISFTPKLSPVTSFSQAERASQIEPFYAKILSIRVVLVCITLLTVIAMGIGLIFLSVSAQNSIVNDLSEEITSQVVKQLTSECGELFRWADTELSTAQLMFQLEYNLTMPGNGTNPFKALPAIAEYLWSIVRKHPVGIETEFDFLDGRMMGFESFEYSSDIYWVDWVDDELHEWGWPANLNKSIASIDMSPQKYLFDFPFGAPHNYSWIADPTRDYLLTCDSPSICAMCNAKGEMIGFLAVSLGLSSITDLLRSTTDDIAGKIFIMDHAQQLVASSTDSKTIFTTDERWIADVVKEMDGEYNNLRKVVNINGTEYYLTIVHWNQFSGIDWNFVMLLEQRQFLGKTQTYFGKSVLAAALVSAASIGIVLFVTWATTKPLFILAKDLDKMSTLDLDISDMETPRLLEVGRLYKSVVSMYVALRSFKKFVPVQIISKIIKSEKEAVAELVPAKVTIIFQDIEGFTGLSEVMDPVSLAKLTSEYMETMTEIICNHGGTIDKYIGDCIMSLFNAPEPLPNHPLEATKSAVECIKALSRKNVDWQNVYGCQMQCRIGISTGDVLIGNMGSNYRMNYTAFGDTVNVAARLEGVNKYFGTRIIISKAVFTALQGQLVTRKLSKVRVSGKALPTSIYEVRGDIRQDTTKLFKSYECALRAFKRREFQNAIFHIQQAEDTDPTDVATKKLKHRIEEAFRLAPLPDSWTYVEDLLKH